MCPKSKNQLSKEDEEARKFVVRNVANDLFSLLQGPRSQHCGVLGHERHKARNICPWLTDGVLDHQLKTLKKIQMKRLAVRVLEANAPVDQQLISDLQLFSDGPRTGGRPTGSTIDATKTLDDRKRKAFDDAASTCSKLKVTKKKLPRGGLKQITERAKLENGLENEENWTIAENSVSSRHKRSNGNVKLINVAKPGPALPSAAVEPLLVELCIQRAQMGQPLSQSEGTSKPTTPTTCPSCMGQAGLWCQDTMRPTSRCFASPRCH
jgi:hypothetical protein